MFLDIVNRYFKGFYEPKNTFFEGTKKFSVQIFLGLFVHVQRWLMQKNTASRYNSKVILSHIFIIFSRKYLVKI